MAGERLLAAVNLKLCSVDTVKGEGEDEGEAGCLLHTMKSCENVAVAASIPNLDTKWKSFMPGIFTNSHVNTRKESITVQPT